MTDRRDDEEETARLTPWTTPALPPRPEGLDDPGPSWTPPAHGPAQPGRRAAGDDAETARYAVSDRDPVRQDRADGPVIGDPPPAPAWRAEARKRRLLPLLAGAAVVAVVGVAAVAALGGGGGDVAAPTTGGTATAASPAATSAAGKPPAQPETSPGTVSAGSEPVAGGPSGAEAEAEQRLATLRQEGLAAVPRDGRWVAQLASKYAGMTVPDEVSDDGDHTFTAVEVLAEHERLRQRLGPAVFLVRTGDYGKRQLVQGKELWVTFATDASFGSPDDVRAWCAAQFGDLAGAALDNACTPRRLNPPRG